MWMDYGNCSICFQKQQWNWQSNNVTSTHHDYLFPLYSYTTSWQKFKTPLLKKYIFTKCVAYFIEGKEKISSLNIFFFQIKYIALGVQGRNKGSLPFIASLPMFSGWKPSTSFSMLISVRTFSSFICFGNGSWTNIPDNVTNQVSRINIQI